MLGLRPPSLSRGAGAFQRRGWQRVSGKKAGGGAAPIKPSRSFVWSTIPLVVLFTGHGPRAEG